MIAWLASVVSMVIWMSRVVACLPGSRSVKESGATGPDIAAQVAHTDRGRIVPTLFGFGGIGHRDRDDASGASLVSADDEAAPGSAIAGTPPLVSRD